MYLLTKALNQKSKRLIIGSSILISSSFFTGIFKKWNQRVIYPPPPQEITTNNRLFPNYVSNSNELHDLILFKEPLLLNFTYSDLNANYVTQSLFNILANKQSYPLNFPINSVNISADSPGGRDLMLRYSIHKIPSILLLKKQMPVDRFVPDTDTFKEQDLVDWIKSIEE